MKWYMICSAIPFGFLSWLPIQNALWLGECGVVFQFICLVMCIIYLLHEAYQKQDKQ